MTVIKRRPSGVVPSWALVVVAQRCEARATRRPGWWARLVEWWHGDDPMLWCAECGSRQLATIDDEGVPHCAQHATEMRVAEDVWENEL